MNEKLETLAIEEHTSVSKISYQVIKRVFDIVCALLGCILLIPAIIVVKIISLFCKDYDSIFYTQKRIGKDGQEFKLYKFRSMVKNADEVLNQTLQMDKIIEQEYKVNKKLKDDPRITKAGKVLRKYSIDELPQFINVLKGDMSLIGNRPYLPREENDMGESYIDIIKTKPGITGYWQVNGRSNLTFKKRLKLESYYSNHQSLKLDIKIFFKTFSIVIFGKDAK